MCSAAFASARPVWGRLPGEAVGWPSSEGLAYFRACPGAIGGWVTAAIWRVGRALAAFAQAFAMPATGAKPGAARRHKRETGCRLNAAGLDANKKVDPASVFCTNQCPLSEGPFKGRRAGVGLCKTAARYLIPVKNRW